MEKKVRKGAGTRTGSKRPKSGAGSKAGAAKETEANVPGSDEASERFVRDLMVRGEASKPDAEGKLPPQATHVVIDEGEGDTPTVKRVRYKTF